MSRSGRGRRWFVLAILCAGFALVLLYTWQSGQDLPRAPLPMPEGGAIAERVSDTAEPTSEAASSVPVPRGDDRGVVTGEIRVPPSTGEKDGTGITISILCEGQILALTPATPGSFEIKYPRLDPDAEYELRASGFGWIPVSRRLTRSEQDVGTLRMIPGLCYGGIALDAEGKPVEGVCIRFYWNRVLQGESDPTTRDGRFSVGVHATGLGGWSDQDLRKLGYLLPLEPGLAYQRVPCEPAGFSGEHEFRLVHDRRVVLRITDGETGLPAEGARCTVSVPVGPWPPRLQVIDTASADEDGLVPICWSPVMGTAHLSIQIERRTFTGFLWKSLPEDREEPVEVPLPGEQQVSSLSLRCILGAEDAPVAGAMVQVLAKHQGGQVSPFTTGNTDASGDLSWSFAEVSGIGPTALEFFCWRVRYVDETGRLRLVESDGHVDWRAGLRTPYTIRLDELRDESIYPGTGSFWLRIVEEGSRRELTPRFLTGAWVRGDAETLTLSLYLGRPVVQPDGTRIWRARRAGLPEHTLGARAIQLAITVEGRMPFLVELPVIEYLEALDRGPPLVLELPRLPDHHRTVRVLRPAGKSVAGAIVSVHPVESEGAAMWFTRPRWLRSEADGRVDVSHLYGGCRYRIQALDSMTGEAGFLADYDPSSAKEQVTLHLIKPRVLTFMVQRPDGSPVDFRVQNPDGSQAIQLHAGLTSVRFTLPPIGGKVSPEGSVVTFPPAVLELYSLGLSAPARLVDRTTRPLRPREIAPVWRLRLAADQVGDIVIAQPRGE